MKPSCKVNCHLANSRRLGSTIMYAASAVMTLLLGGGLPRLNSMAMLEGWPIGINDHVCVTQS